MWQGKRETLSGSPFSTPCQGLIDPRPFELPFPGFYIYTNSICPEPYQDKLSAGDETNAAYRAYCGGENPESD